MAGGLRRAVSATERGEHDGLLLLAGEHPRGAEGAGAQVQLRLKLNGSVEVYRIVARGVRLRGRLVDGKVKWGQVDKLLPPPINNPFALPNIAVDIAYSTISLATPFGPLGFALQ